MSARNATQPKALVTGGAGTIGAAVVRRLLRDGDWEVRVSDQREAPDWMASSCELHRGDLRLAGEAALNHGAAIPATAVVTQLTNALVAAGGGDLDYSALATVVFGLAAIQQPPK